MKIIRLKKEEFIEKFGDVDAMTVRERGTESIIYVPDPGASTKEMLHEIYHAKYSPQLEEIEAGKKWLTPDELASEELRAQAFAAERTGHMDREETSALWDYLKEGYAKARGKE